MNADQTECLTQVILNLNEKYKDDQYMSLRLLVHLTNLPYVLEQEKKKHDERIIRFNELTSEHENFHRVFLSKYHYFYSPYNNNYYEYNGKTYSVANEDDIHYLLLSTITDEGKLTQWKHKTKLTILKKIKEQHIYKSTPESYTIQNVLTFLTGFFETKDEAKYFLTALGDCILKKNVDNLLYFVSSDLKSFISMIDFIVNSISGTSILSKFITRYHDSHNLKHYRLIKSCNKLRQEIVKDTLKDIGLDIICVATHYSDRYGNAEEFMKAEEGYGLDCSHILFLTNNTLNDIVDNFIHECIDKTPNSEMTMSMKQMLNIWRTYLSKYGIPSVAYLEEFQASLTSKLSYVINPDTTSKLVHVINPDITFTNVTSKLLTNVNSFLSFWETNIVITGDDKLDVYEVDELLKIYKQINKKPGQGQITTSEIVKLINHYFALEVTIIDNKYVTNISCCLWNKKEDISEFLNIYKSNTIKTNVSEIIPIDEIYHSYTNYVKAKNVIEQKKFLVVSKKYFEDYLTIKLTNYIKFDTFVSSSWILDKFLF